MPPTVRISFFYRPDVPQASRWEAKIVRWLKQRHPKVQVAKNPQAVIVLGGDGTILEAAKAHPRALILGLNLGGVGFLASVREPKRFLSALDRFFSGKYHVAERMTLEAIVVRKRRQVFRTTAVNEIAIQNPLGMVELSAAIEDHPIQQIRGSGALIATPTGSTAYNLSAHGPIVTPGMRALVMTELLDHNIPTPSIIVEATKKISFVVSYFRERKLLSVTESGEPIDVILIADGETIFSLRKGDIVSIRASKRTIRFAELEDHYFFKSLREKFGFK